ncbi:MAG TPA: flavin reductase family protein [Candidatus Binataceae bacterium]|nr:flavin reductase family protein [Candidatus Binataceae bacterium]
MPIEKTELRRVMGHFATGVTVITSRRASGELHGLTANAFTSVSLTPPLVLVCVDKKAESYPCFDESKVFTVNILAADQESVSRRFAVSGGNKFDGISHRLGANGTPILDGVIAWVECRVTSAIEAGDHTIYVGEIEQSETPREAKPLLFYRGGYRALGD